MNLLCFGGHLDGQTVNLPRDRWYWVAPVPVTVSYLAYDAEPTAPAIDTVLYRCERFMYGTTPNPTSYDPGDWAEYPCLIAEGHPIGEVEALCRFVVLMASTPMTIKGYTPDVRRRQHERNQDRAAARAWMDLMDRVTAGEITLEVAQHQADVWRVQ